MRGGLEPGEDPARNTIVVDVGVDLDTPYTFDETVKDLGVRRDAGAWCPRESIVPLDGEDTWLAKGWIGESLDEVFT